MGLLMYAIVGWRGLSDVFHRFFEPEGVEAASESQSNSGLMNDMELLGNMQMLIGIYMYEIGLAAAFRWTTLKLLRVRTALVLHHVGALVMQLPFLLSPKDGGLPIMRFFPKTGSDVPFFSRQVLNCYTATALNEFAMAFMQMAGSLFHIEMRRIFLSRPFRIFLLSYVNHLWLRYTVFNGRLLRSTYVDPKTRKVMAVPGWVRFHVWFMVLCTPPYHTVQIILPNVKKIAVEIVAKVKGLLGRGVAK